MNASRSWKTPSPVSPSTSKGAVPLNPGLRAVGAQGYTDKYGALGTFGGWPRVPAAFVPKAAARRRASRLAAGGVPLHPGLRAIGAQGARETCSLTVKLPPLGDRPHGSRVWCGSLPLGRWHFEIPPQGVSLTAIHCDGSRIPARAAYAPRQLRGSRAAIGSGGKKARPF